MTQLWREACGQVALLSRWLSISQQSELARSHVVLLAKGATSSIAFILFGLLRGKERNAGCGANLSGDSLPVFRSCSVHFYPSLPPSYWCKFRFYSGAWRTGVSRNCRKNFVSILGQWAADSNAHEGLAATHHRANDELRPVSILRRCGAASPNGLFSA